MASHTLNGKAFEYALLNEFLNRLSTITSVSVIKNDPYTTAKKCFDSFNEKEQGEYILSSSFAVNFLIDLEPRLSNGISNEDILQLEIVSDLKGQTGDVRDVLAIRSLQKWEIGVSAKNNHRAVKHPRLSNTIDFGEKWLGLQCSSTYFEEINPIFANLTLLKEQSDNKKTWKSLENCHTTVYLPILHAFKKELVRLSSETQGIFAQRLVEYLIGNQDFYKVIKAPKEVEIQAWNLHGTLNLPFENLKPKFKIQRLKLPNRLIEVVFQEDSETTLLVTLNEGWQISFRIHSASTRIEASLKFDINLVSSPHTLFVNHLSVVMPNN